MLKLKQETLIKGDLTTPSDTSTTFGKPIVTGVSAVTVSSDRLRAVREITLNIESLSVAVLAANDYGSAKITDLPDTNLLVVGAECSLLVTKGGVSSGLVAGTDIICGIGTTATADTTISTTDQNIIAATTLSTDGLALDMDVHNLAASFAGVGILDGASNALYFNIAVTGSDPSVNDAVTVDGTLTLYVLDLGNVTS